MISSQIRIFSGITVAHLVSHSYLALNKEQGIGIVLLSNYCFGSASIVDEYLDAIFKFITKKDLYPLMPLDPVGNKILEAMMQR